MKQIISCAKEMEALGAKLVKDISTPAVIYLHGDLGAGKTTLVRGAVHQLGHQGLVKSPTFTLVETYSFPSLEVYHFDLYRISDPEELEYIGIREFSSGPSICFIEWPNLGKPLIPKATMEISIEYVQQGRQVSIENYPLQ
ncbi:MAG: tRNA (adenosine(37)-N6)-threonylcarbamoyltransferase complex ATPase subunit type 1 TsaE [Gammaproteobacteria bacterium]|nr:tRNA (adenosine(37)-N6)-threonylcarbamoyltransferase complex ATPase subunit type 1 TsaE [Gammaproteobacteria bacterium]